jgi:hypothetical protein
MAKAVPCSICYDELNEANAVVVCWNSHTLCSGCYDKCLADSRSSNKNCPECRVKMFDYTSKSAEETLTSDGITLRPSWSRGYVNWSVSLVKDQRTGLLYPVHTSKYLPVKDEDTGLLYPVIQEVEEQTRIASTIIQKYVRRMIVLNTIESPVDPYLNYQRRWACS